MLARNGVRTCLAATRVWAKVFVGFVTLGWAVDGMETMNIQPEIRDLFDPNSVWGAILYACVFGAAALVGARLFRITAERVFEHGAWHVVERTTAGFLIQAGQIGVYIVAAVLYSHLIPALRAMGTALLTGASVLSVVLGLAAQTTLGNLIAGAAIVLYRPFRVGDRVQLALPTGTVVGIVRSLTLGYTVLTSDDETRIVVPNSVMASQAFLSFTTPDRRTLAAVTVQMPADIEAAEVRDPLLNFVQHQQHVQQATVTVRPSKGPDGTATVQIRAWCTNADAARQIEVDMLDRARALIDQLSSARARAQTRRASARS